MCGIAGFAGAGTLDDLRAMNAAQAHRGPDADGQWSDAALGLFLGHRRLSIIDLAGGTQPMWSIDGRFAIVFNGEIYNFAELRAELSAMGARFATDHSDTEVLLEAYRRWGDECVHRLNGMWAFVLYDVERRRLFGSRDRFGKKPLYYLDRPGLFAFASELTALTAHRAIAPAISPLAVKKYFAYGYIPAPHTIYEGVRKLPGGHSFEYDLAAGRLREWRYWDFVLEPQDDDPAAHERWCDQLCELMGRAVKRRLVSDVPIGAFISGGIDSSAVVAFARRHCAGDLRTFSIGFEEASHNELPYARL
ncbi:MAG TPA: asparagine synthase (glutamine-hydrolyzing), partial [Usitatibacter sp.]|nr:asparagine synthase (glutamine-hydrolyzing) [Usitatibacter sp.]